MERVEFRTCDGTTLRGDYYPVKVAKAPIVVMTQGLTLLKEHYIPDFAARFQAAGFAALIYDHRGWGSSNGTPRNAVDPIQQAEDYHDAVIFARSIPGIDPERVAIWGIGHSGGACMIAGGDDPYAKAVILVMPFTSGAFEASNFPAGMLARAYKDREARCRATGPPQHTYVPVWDESIEQARGERGEILLHSEGPFEFRRGAKVRSDAAGTPFENQMTLESFYHLARVEPRDHVSKIAPRSLLYLAAVEDPLSGPYEMQKEVFALAKEPKKFVTLDYTHIDNYFENFEATVGAQVDFLTDCFGKCEV